MIDALYNTGGEPMIIRSAELMDKIQDWLTILQTRIKISNALGQTDVNKAAEDFYCGLLNIVLGGYHLKNLNLLQMDFPAIDLGDIQKKLEAGMAESTKGVLKNLERSNLITSLEEFAASRGTEGIAGWGEVHLSNWRFPWQRVFEVRMDLSLGSLTKPN